MSDDLLRDAFRDLRELHDGVQADDDEATLRRALRATRKRERSRQITKWVVLPFAAMLVAEAAWAGATGRLTTMARDVSSALYGERAPETAPAPSSALGPARAPATASAPTETAAVDPPSPPEPSPPAPPEPEPEPPSPPARAPAPTRALVAPSATSPAIGAPTASAPTAPIDPNASLFDAAYRIHFVEHDPARALDAWDRYLAVAPRGPLAPEARYNRALALVRLGRDDDAARELQPFADGAYGTYRRASARALLDAMGRGR